MSDQTEAIRAELNEEMEKAWSYPDAADAANLLRPVVIKAIHDIADLGAELEAAKAREEALAPRHRCEMVAVAQWNDVGGRANWIGRLLEVVPGWEEETHCLHFKTPLKGEIVLLCIEDDFYQFAALCQAAIKDPIDPEYFRLKADSYVGNVRNLREAGVPEALAASEPPGEEGT